MTEMIKPWPHQHELFDEALPILKENALVYLATEERTGKSLVAIMLAEDTVHGGRVLIITKKKAIEGWNKILNGYIHICGYTVINYESVHKVAGEYDFIIIDEPHAFIAAYPKKSKTHKNVAKLVQDKPIIFASATSHAQGTQMLYHQLCMSTWSPWSQFKDFYAWYQEYAARDKAGHVKTVYIGPNRTAVDYKAVDHDRVWKDVKHLFVTKTRQELGFEHEPNDIIHYVELSKPIRDIYNTLLKDKVLNFTHGETGEDYTLVCDSSIKLRWALHMLEGGSIKYTPHVDKKQAKLIKEGKAKPPKPEYLVLGNLEKVDYILNTWGDSQDLVIMFQYKADLMKLERHFKNARLLQATSYAEGVDLSTYKHLVIYSQDFSTSKHTQRRARQANLERKEPINVHFLLVKKAISEQVYKTVSLNKTNFVDSVFEREEI